MKNLIVVLFIFVVLISLTGCGTMNSVSADVQPCNLSILKIKDIKIKGDKEGFVTRAVKSELYKFGARVSPDGVDIIGDVIWSQAGSPLMLSVEVASMSFASTAENGAPLMGTVRGSQSISRKIAEDFCKCSAAPTLNRSRPAQK